MTDDVFRPISGPRAFAEVVDQITYGIASGRFLPGSWLPNIDDLARRMKVSRPTVGDALRVLAEAGVVETRRGNTGGVLVNSWVVPPRLPGLGSRRPAHGLIALVEARRPVEMELASLASQRITDQDLTDLQRAVEMLKNSIDNRHHWVQANNLFHYAVGRAARSPVLAQFQHQLIQEMMVLMDGWSAEYYSGAQHVIEMHELTLEALRTRDGELVRRAMDNHLRDAETVALTSDSPNGRRRVKARPSARPRKGSASLRPARRR